MSMYQKLKIATILLMLLSGCSKIASPEVLQGTQLQEELAHLQIEAWDTDTEYALDALAIPYIKDQEAQERLAQFYWCYTPVLEYLVSNERPSDNVLIARAAILEARWFDTVYD